MGRNKLQYKDGSFINGLKFIEETKSNTKIRKGKFECTCGNQFITFISLIKNGNTTSCGCYHKKMSSNNMSSLLLKNNKPALVHGDSSRTYIYTLWANIKQRCFDTNLSNFNDYGGRGIKMYNNWIKDYPAFKGWILTNLGERPEGYTLDRINNDGNYEPNNLRWATYTEQNKNQRKRNYYKKL